jgi:hypothetical protein
VTGKTKELFPRGLKENPPRGFSKGVRGVLISPPHTPLKQNKIAIHFKFKINTHFKFKIRGRGW